MAETITIPISEYGYAAFSASMPLDFGALHDYEVYYLPHYSYAELRLKRVKGVAPTHFGVLIAVPKGVRQITVPIANKEQAEPSDMGTIPCHLEVQGKIKKSVML